MGNCPSSSSVPKLIPEGLRQINDSLFELYAPEQGNPEVDIIFVHGLQPANYEDAYWKTWSNDRGDIWPRTMLAKRFPKARMLSVSYDSCARVTATTGRFTLDNIAEVLLMDIILSDRADVGRKRPVILVGHSFGGFVIKRLLLEAFDRKTMYDPKNFRRDIEMMGQFFQNLKGIFYYATPHAGSELATLAAKVPRSSPVLNLLKACNAKSERLNQKFEQWRRIHLIKVPISTLYELDATTIWGFNFVIVTEASARRDSDHYYPAQANHFTICKPPDMEASTFQRLEEFIRLTATN